MQDRFSRRTFLSFTAAAPLVAAVTGKQIPVGLELYSARNDMQKDLMGTVKAVCQMGYQCVEFYSPYFTWKPEYAKEVRKLLDDNNVKCYSTHNGPESYAPAGIPKAIELNQILGAKYIVLASAGSVKGSRRLEEGCRSAERGQREVRGRGNARRLSQSSARV